MSAEKSALRFVVRLPLRLQVNATGKGGEEEGRSGKSKKYYADFPFILYRRQDEAYERGWRWSARPRPARWVHTPPDTPPTQDTPSPQPSHESMEEGADEGGLVERAAEEWRWLVNGWMKQTLAALNGEGLPYTGGKIVKAEDGAFLKAMVKHYANSPLLGFAYWHYTDVLVSTAQLAAAMGMGTHSRAFLDLLKKFKENGGEIKRMGQRSYVRLKQIVDHFGLGVADRILLQPSQIAALLGTTPTAASSTILSLRLAEPRPDRVIARYEAVRSIYRIPSARSSRFAVPAWVQERIRGRGT